MTRRVISSLVPMGSLIKIDLDPEPEPESENKRCHWCNAEVTDVCPRCDKRFCNATCSNRAGYARNPAQPCQVPEKAITKSKELAAAGW